MFLLFILFASQSYNTVSSFIPDINDCSQILFRHAQLLANDRILVVVNNQVDTISIFCETFGGIGQAVTANRPKKIIRQEKTGKDVIIAFDEGKCMLALCSSLKVCQIYGNICLRFTCRTFLETSLYFCL